MSSRYSGRPDAQSAIDQASIRRYCQFDCKRVEAWRAHCRRDDVLSAIGERIRLLKSTVPEFFDRQAIRKTRDSARALKGAITKVQVALAKASPEMRLRLKLDVPQRTALLEDLKRECDAAIKSTLTAGRANEVKQWCARSSIGLILKFSKRQPTSTERSAYRNIASLLYETVTGEQEKDFERTCESVLRDYRPLLRTNRNQKIR